MPRPLIPRRGQSPGGVAAGAAAAAAASATSTTASDLHDDLESAGGPGPDGVGRRERDHGTDGGQHRAVLGSVDDGLHQHEHHELDDDGEAVRHGR